MGVQPQNNIFCVCLFDGQMFLTLIDQPAREPRVGTFVENYRLVLPDVDRLGVRLNAIEIAANMKSHGKSLLVLSKSGKCYTM